VRERPLGAVFVRDRRQRLWTARIGAFSKPRLKAFGFVSGQERHRGARKKGVGHVPKAGEVRCLPHYSRTGACHAAPASFTCWGIAAADGLRKHVHVGSRN